MTETDNTQQVRLALGADAPPDDATKAAAAQARVLMQQTSPDPPAAVPEFLGQLALLYGVPFENLLPDARMLPPESLRFFYLDVNWVESMVDGALSTGAHSDRDIRFQAVLREKISTITHEAANQVRSAIRGEAAPTIAGDRVAAGFLLRSAVVSGWPGLEIAAYSDETEHAGQQIPPLRIERLSPDVLLAIFAQVPKMIVLHEPQETLHFGVSGLPLGARNLTALAVDPIPDPLPPRLAAVPIPLRPPENPNRPNVRTVIDIGKLVTSFPAAVAPQGRLSSGDFAAEMIDPAGKIRFVPDPTTPEAQ